MCIVVGGRATDSRHVDGLRIVGTKSEVAAHVEAQVRVCIVMGGLHILGTKSEVAAQAEAQVQCELLWVGGLQIAGTWMGYG